MNDRANNAKKRILVIEDEPDIARGLNDALEFEGFEVDLAGTASEGLRRVRNDAPALVVLDLMLPDANGFSVCEQIRKGDPLLPIIMLTARSQEVDKIRGLEAGADDYVTKPFSIGELVARINALFRRLNRPVANQETMTIGRAQIFPGRHELHQDGQVHPLTTYEVELLRLLYGRAGQVVSRDEILEKVWGTSTMGANRSVDNCVVKLRKKIEVDPANPRTIVTIYGSGYKLIP